MQLLIDIVLVVLLAIVVVQDLKQREISWLLIPILFGCFWAKGFLLISSGELIRNSLLNICFIVLQLLVLTVYISLKNKKIINVINSYLGLGDVLFFVVICVAFSSVNFILFYVISLFFTLGGFIIYNLFVTKTTKEIPLAGAMAMVMITLILLNQWMPQFDFYNDNYLTGLLINK